MSSSHLDREDDRSSTMSRRRLIRILTLSVPISYSASVWRVQARGAASSLDRAVSRDCGAWEVQSLKINRFLTCAVSVAGMKITAMIDSGLTRTALTTDLIHQLGLTPSGHSIAKGFSGTLTTAEYQLQNLTAGPVVLDHLTVLGIDHANFPFPSGVSAVLGRDVLERLVLDVDFPNDSMRLCPVQDQHSRAEFTSIPTSLGPDNIYGIPVSIEGYAVPASMLDTGSNAACSISYAYAQKLGLIDGRPHSTALTAGIEGETADLVTTIREIAIGPFKLYNVPVTIVANWLLQTPMNIGWPMFRAFRTIFDFGASAIWLKADAKILAEPFPKDRSGIGAARLVDRLLVRYVAKDSPADRAGLVIGDIITAIDGRQIDSTYPAPGERQGYKSAGTRMDLELSDGKHVSLILSDYF